MRNIPIVWPKGYFLDRDTFRIIALDGDANEIFWPDVPSEQAIAWQIPGPLFLEPGSKVVLRPAGVGVAASVFQYDLIMKRCKLIRALPPDLSKA